LEAFGSTLKQYSFTAEDEETFVTLARVHLRQLKFATLVVETDGIKREGIIITRRNEIAVRPGLALALGRIAGGTDGLRMMEELYDSHRARVSAATKKDDQATVRRERRRFVRLVPVCALTALFLVVEGVVSKIFKLSR
jgi:hypothetical protein